MEFIHFVAPPLPHYISSGMTRYEVGDCHPNRRAIEVFDLLAVCKGVLYIAEEEQSFEIRKGEFLILRPDAHHYGFKPCTETTEFYWAHFQTTGEWHAGQEAWSGSKLDQPEEGPFFRSIERFMLTLPQYHRLSESLQVFDWLEEVSRPAGEEDVAPQWKQQLLFQQMLYTLGNVDRPKWETPPRRLADSVAQFLRNRYADKIDHQVLKDAFHFHPVYITRCMRQVYGCTPLDYLNHYRIEQAKLLLKNSYMPIHQIAGETGFNSSSYFIRMFTQLTGGTPKHYREGFRGGSKST
ncbi:helix-turn-helix transcriptional regulator [Paenibacillus hodogayensis]|uniref:Helix-turn-helix transcriptional regulator n=1 Tax=Paenibacillus hodogayensis TaxID=279208 RepID=A0ABV5W0H6_9BACL